MTTLNLFLLSFLSLNLSKPPSLFSHSFPFFLSLFPTLPLSLLSVVKLFNSNTHENALNSCESKERKRTETKPEPQTHNYRYNCICEIHLHCLPAHVSAAAAMAATTAAVVAISADKFFRFILDFSLHAK